MLRLMLALTAALVAVGVAQYTAVERTLTATALDNLKAAHAADATVLLNLHDAEGGGMAAVTALLGHVASRPGVERVVLRDAEGRDVVVGTPATPATHAAQSLPGGTAADRGAGTDAGHGAGTSMGEDADADTGGAHGDLADMPGGQGAAEAVGQITVAVPVMLGGEPFALEVQRDDTELRESVDALRRVVLMTLASGLVLVLPLFYLVGGRALASSHRDAVEGSTTDGLTGLGNHRLFHDDLRRAVSTAHRHHRPLTLVLVDLDGFKQVNDTRGHAHGDQVLSAVGAVLSEPRDGDRAYRIGGDEFALLLADTDTEGALHMAERVRARVEHEVGEVTTSIGLASLAVSRPDAPSLLLAADEALYRAKGEGKNRVAEVPQPQPEPQRQPGPQPQPQP